MDKFKESTIFRYPNLMAHHPVPNCSSLISMDTMEVPPAMLKMIVSLNICYLLTNKPSMSDPKDLVLVVTAPAGILMEMDKTPHQAL